MIVQFPNKKIVYIACSKKCGTTSITSIMGYPRIGSHKARRMKETLVPLGEWWKQLSSFPYDYNTIDFKFAVVRDPVKRLESCFLDRVLLKNRNNIHAELKSWDDLINNLDYFRNKLEYTDLRRHSLPQVDVLGKDTSIYNDVFKTSELGGRFLNEMARISECEIPPIKTKTTNRNKHPITITEEHIKIIKEYYSDDYTYWGSYFQ